MINIMEDDAMNLKLSNCPKPFVKWAGGKTQLLNDISSYLPDDFNSRFDRYFEPFVGGGAVFFHLICQYDFDYVYLGDTNGDLILTYIIIQNNLDDLKSELKNLSKNFSETSEEKRKKMFYQIREEFNEIHCIGSKIPSKNHVEIASKMIFLNKTCFNGLYRVNKSGKFNVPFANPKNPLIYDEFNLSIVSEVLQDVKIKCLDYSKSKKYMNDKSFVYMDPPYRPINGKKSFEGYSKSDFNDGNQKELAEFCKEIDETGVKFILNNSDPTNYIEDDDFFEILYNDFNINKVYAKRSINSKGNKRGAITELLVNNF